MQLYHKSGTFADPRLYFVVVVVVVFVVVVVVVKQNIVNHVSHFQQKLPPVLSLFISLEKPDIFTQSFP